MNVLHIDSSPVLEPSVTRQLSARVVARLLERRPDVNVTVRDVGLEAPGHAAADALAVLRNKALNGLSAQQAGEKALADRLVAELFAADVLVIGAPMYNFTVPTQLKAWIDRVCQAGVTFRYTPEGPVGLVTGKTAVLAAARGGFYSTPEQARRDFHVRYMTEVLGFIGITDVRVILAEGVNISPEHRARALDQATHEIDALFAEAANPLTTPQLSNTGATT